MDKRKLSNEIKHCLDCDSCGDCDYYEHEIKMTCSGLLQKAYERIKSYEEMEDRKNGEID